MESDEEIICTRDDYEIYEIRQPIAVQSKPVKIIRKDNNNNVDISQENDFVSALNLSKATNSKGEIEFIKNESNRKIIQGKSTNLDSEIELEEPGYKDVDYKMKIEFKKNDSNRKSINLEEEIELESDLEDVDHKKKIEFKESSKATNSKDKIEFKENDSKRKSTDIEEEIELESDCEDVDHKKKIEFKESDSLATSSKTMESDPNSKVIKRKSISLEEEIELESDCEETDQRKKIKLNEGNKETNMEDDSDQQTNEEYQRIQKLIFLEFNKNINLSHLPLSIITESLKSEFKADQVRKYLAKMEKQNKIFVAEEIVYLL